MKNRMRHFYPFIILLVLAHCTSSNKTPNLTANSWITTPDRSKLLEPSNILEFRNEKENLPMITVDTGEQYQIMDGFGYTLTGGSAQLIMQKLDSTNRAILLRELFLTENDGIGISYLRISIGASDLDE